MKPHKPMRSLTHRRQVQRSSISAQRWLIGLARAATAAPNCPVRAGMRAHSVRPRYAQPVAQTIAATHSRRATLSLAVTLALAVTLTLFLASGYKTHPHAHERAA